MPIDLQVITGVGAGVVSVIGLVIYGYTIVTNSKYKPSKASWWIWSLVYLILLISQDSLGVEDGIWMPLAYFVITFVIAIMSLWYGESGWTRLDSTAVVGALLGVMMWWITSSPLSALLTNLVIDAFAVAPTVRKSILEPWTEPLFAWSLIFAGIVMNLFSIEYFTFEFLVYPFYMLATGGLIFFSLIFSPYRKKVH